MSNNQPKGIVESNDEHLISRFADSINKDDVEQINHLQRSLLNCFEKSNQMLSYCNELSNQHYQKLSKNYRVNTDRLNEMYRDLDHIFHRIRLIKQKMHKKYPDISFTIDDNKNEEKN